MAFPGTIHSCLHDEKAVMGHSCDPSSQATLLKIHYFSFPRLGGKGHTTLKKCGICLQVSSALYYNKVIIILADKELCENVRGGCEGSVFGYVCLFVCLFARVTQKLLLRLT